MFTDAVIAQASDMSRDEMALFFHRRGFPLDQLDATYEAVQEFHHKYVDIPAASRHIATIVRFNSPATKR